MVAIVILTRGENGNWAELAISHEREVSVLVRRIGGVAMADLACRERLAGDIRIEIVCLMAEKTNAHFSECVKDIGVQPQFCQ